MKIIKYRQKHPRFASRNLSTGPIQTSAVIAQGYAAANTCGQGTTRKNSGQGRPPLFFEAGVKASNSIISALYKPVEGGSSVKG